MRQALLKNMDELRRKSMSPRRGEAAQATYQDPPHRQNPAFHSLHDKQENEFAQRMGQAGQSPRQRLGGAMPGQARNRSTGALSDEDEDIQAIAQKIVAKKAYIWAFGANKDGEIGVGSQRDQLQPRAIANHLEGGSARHIASGSHHTVVVSKSGDVYVCGSHLHGKLGLPSQGIIHLTKLTHLNLPVRAKSVACGDYHTMCLTEEGHVYAWGGTLHKKTGETSGMPKNEPRLV